MIWTIDKGKAQKGGKPTHLPTIKEGKRGAKGNAPNTPRPRRKRLYIGEERAQRWGRANPLIMNSQAVWNTELTLHDDTQEVLNQPQI